jgi:hypothetical protein
LPETEQLSLSAPTTGRFTQLLLPDRAYTRAYNTGVAIKSTPVAQPGLPRGPAEKRNGITENVVAPDWDPNEVDRRELMERQNAPPLEEIPEDLQRFFIKREEGKKTFREVRNEMLVELHRVYEEEDRAVFERHGQKGDFGQRVLDGDGPFTYHI